MKLSTAALTMLSGLLITSTIAAQDDLSKPTGRLEKQKEKHDRPAMVQSPTESEIMRSLGMSTADIAKAKAKDPDELSKPAKPVDAKPSRAKRETNPASPTVDELLEIIRKQPGGPELIEKSKRGIVGLGAGVGIVSEKSPNVDYTIRIRASTSGWPSMSGVGTLYRPETWFPSFSSGTTEYWGPFWRNSESASPVGAYDVKPYLEIDIDIATSGYYMVSFLAERGTYELKKFTRLPLGATVYALVKSFDTRAATNSITSHPALINLSAGTHVFYIVPIIGEVAIYEISLTKM